MLNLDRLRQRIAQRREQSEKQRATGRRTPHAAVIKQQEERKELLSAYQRSRQTRLSKARDEHPKFARYLEVLARELPETGCIEEGVVDLDLDNLVHALRLRELPEAVRFMALEESYEFIVRVHKRHLKTTDITNYTHLFDPAFVSSLDEVRTALRLS